jgi:hypothetical protein
VGAGLAAGEIVAVESDAVNEAVDRWAGVPGAAGLSLMKGLVYASIVTALAACSGSEPTTGASAEAPSQTPETSYRIPPRIAKACTDVDVAVPCAVYVGEHPEMKEAVLDLRLEFLRRELPKAKLDIHRQRRWHERAEDRYHRCRAVADENEDCLTEAYDLQNADYWFAAAHDYLAQVQSAIQETREGNI